MLTYTEMYPPVAKPWVESITSINVGLAETFLVMVNGWHGVCQEMSRGLIGPAWFGVSAPAAQARRSTPDAPVTPAPPEAPAMPAPQEAPEPQALQEQAEVMPDAMPRNAAMVILTNPAQAAEAAARDDDEDRDEADDEADTEAGEMDDDAEDAVDVRDDTSDDIAEEIEREAAEEAAVVPPADLAGTASPARPEAAGSMP